MSFQQWFEQVEKSVQIGSNFFKKMLENKDRPPTYHFFIMHFGLFDRTTGITFCRGK
jgi:hypothetical protein